VLRQDIEQARVSQDTVIPSFRATSNVALLSQGRKRFEPLSRRVALTAASK